MHWNRSAILILIHLRRKHSSIIAVMWSERVQKSSRTTVRLWGLLVPVKHASSFCFVQVYAAEHAFEFACMFTIDQS